MEVYSRLIKIVDANLIYCLIPMILTLFFVELIFKNRLETKKTLGVVRWIIISYTLITLSFFLIGMILQPDDYAFYHRATGTYAWAYWLMLLTALVLPFSLLVKKLGNKYWYVLWVAFGMKIGRYFEYLTLITIHFHRDYTSELNNSEYLYSILSSIGKVCLQGMLVSILLLGVFEWRKRTKNLYKRNKS